MAAYITQVERIRAQILRNAQATGAATASSMQGPMVYNEFMGVALDTTNPWVTSVAGTGTVARAVVTARPVIRLASSSISCMTDVRQSTTVPKVSKTSALTDAT